MLSTRLHNDPLPGFVSAAAIRRAAAEALRPPRKVSVSEAAELHRRLNNPGSYVGPWRNSKTPFGVEPMDRAVSRSIDELWFVGPSQVIKTELLLNIIGHAIKYRPADILVISATRDLALDFARRRVEKGLLNPSADLRAEVGPSRSDDKALDKIFNNGSMLTIAWPVAGQLASRPVPIVMLDEFDRMPDDIGGEGDAATLGRNRKKTFGKNGTLIGSSSPSRDFKSGIMAHYYEGDQCLLAWQCPECGEYWTPGFGADRLPAIFDHLKWDETRPLGEIAPTAFLVCPHCGGVIEERQKEGMLGSSVWIAKGQSVDRDGNITGARPPGRIASYWLSGLCSPFVAWGVLVEQFVAALAHFEKTGDEGRLRAAFNTDFGIPYVGKSADAAPIEPADLEARKGGYRLGTVPAGVRYLTAAVDIQGDRFEAAVKGWGADNESWLVDRFAIRQLADGRTDVDPAKCPEHWHVLLGRVVNACYPLADDPAQVLRVANTAIDTGGIEGVTPAAKAFWAHARLSGVEDWRITLVKGSNSRAAPMLPPPTHDKDEAGRKLPVKVFVVGVHAIKDMLANRLRREDGGPGCLHTPEDTPARYFSELVAEVKEKGVWVRKGANESWDLEVYNVVAKARMRDERIDWKKPPFWARPMPAGERSAPAVLPAQPSAAAAGGRRVRSKGVH